MTKPRMPPRGAIFLALPPWEPTGLRRIPKRARATKKMARPRMTPTAADIQGSGFSMRVPAMEAPCLKPQKLARMPAERAIRPKVMRTKPLMRPMTMKMMMMIPMTPKIEISNWDMIASISGDETG